MSFSSQVKEELNGIQIKSNCCKKAYIFGVALCAERDGDKLSVTLSDESTAVQFRQFLHSIYKIEPEIKSIRRGCFSATALGFSSNRISEFLDFADSCQNSDDISKYLPCNTCKTVFLRSVFCSRGTVSDPKKSYSLELLTSNEQRAEVITKVIEQLSVSAPGITKRKRGYGLFYRNESVIEDILSICGANRALFTFFDAHVEKDIRNAENRATNCVARNISRTVDAIALQIVAIEKLKENDLFDELPKDIQKTAELRLENQESTLSELASLHEPPISKSGLNHRLSKIIDEAKKRKLI